MIEWTSRRSGAFVPGRRDVQSREADMTIPTLAILAFATWTPLLLFGSVGAYRWRRILTGRASLNDFPADRPEGADWYRRAMRALR